MGPEKTENIPSWVPICGEETFHIAYKKFSSSSRSITYVFVIVLSEQRELLVFVLGMV